MVASKSEQLESVREHVYRITTEKLKKRTISWFECEREQTRRTFTGRERERARTFVRIRERTSSVPHRYTVNDCEAAHLAR